MATLPAGEPVWIVESAKNTPVAKRLWSERPASSHLASITTFQPSVPDTAEEHLLSVLDTIELHHGHYSADPPYSELEIIGCEPSPRISAALNELGFGIVSGSPYGFTASSRTPDDNTRDARQNRMQATARMASAVSSTLRARRRLVRGRVAVRAGLAEGLAGDHQG